VSDSPLGRLAGVVCTMMPCSPPSCALAPRFWSRANDSGKYSEKKDVDLFEIDTVGDVEGVFHLC